MQERRDSIAHALELRLYYTNPSMYAILYIVDATGSHTLQFGGRLNQDWGTSHWQFCTRNLNMVGVAIVVIRILSIRSQQIYHNGNAVALCAECCTIRIWIEGKYEISSHFKDDKNIFSEKGPSSAAQVNNVHPRLRVGALQAFKAVNALFCGFI